MIIRPQQWAISSIFSPWLSRNGRRPTHSSTTTWRSSAMNFCVPGCSRCLKAWRLHGSFSKKSDQRLALQCPTGLRLSKYAVRHNSLTGWGKIWPIVCPLYTKRWCDRLLSPPFLTIESSLKLLVKRQALTRNPNHSPHGWYVNAFSNVLEQMSKLMNLSNKQIFNFLYLGHLLQNDKDIAK